MKGKTLWQSKTDSLRKSDKQDCCEYSLYVEILCKKFKREIVIIFIFISLNMCFWCFTHKAPPMICSRRQFQILLLFKNNNQAWYFMRIVCQQTILMKYHTLFFSKSGEDVAAAVVIGTLRVKRTVLVSQHMFWVRNKKKKDIFKHSLHLCMLGVFSYITFFVCFFQNMLSGTLSDRSRSGLRFCRSWSGSKLFAKAICISGRHR